MVLRRWNTRHLLASVLYLAATACFLCQLQSHSCVRQSCSCSSLRSQGHLKLNCAFLLGDEIAFPLGYSGGSVRGTSKQEQERQEHSRNGKGLSDEEINIFLISYPTSLYNPPSFCSRKLHWLESEE